jgi:methanogenic corrinoid protein MtbC1
MASLPLASGNAGRFVPASATILRAAQTAALNSVGRRLARLFFVHRPAPLAEAADQDIAAGASAIACRIIPQLVASHAAEATRTDAPETGLPGGDFNAFIGELVAHDVAACQARIGAMAARGLAFDRLCRDVLTPAARRLGEMWEDDTASFFDVTAGLGALHTLLHGAAEQVAAAPVREATRRALLASLPGEQHSFGLQMMAALFRQAGWDVTLALETGAIELASIVAGGHFALAGMSLSSAGQEEAVADAVLVLRAASANPGIGILLGGPLAAADPALALEVGADACVGDAADAIRVAEGWRVAALEKESASF